MESVERENHELDAIETKRNKKTLKFADLNENVLIQIFFYLDEEDLFNVIEIDNVYLSSCRAAFRRAHQYEYISLPFKKTNPEVNNDHEEDSVDLKKTLQLLNIFGKNISKLEFAFDEEYPKSGRIIWDSIANNCSQTLIKMKLSCLPIRLKMSNFFEPLHNRGVIRIKDQTTSEVNKFTRLFRKLFNSTEESVKCFTFHIEELNRFIKSNPKLKEFCLTLDDHNISTKYPVENFCNDHQLDDSFIPEKMTVKLDQPFHSSHDTCRYHSKALAQLNIPIDRIEHLEVTSQNFTEQICSYIAKCVYLKSLKVRVVIYDPLFEETAWIDLTKCGLLTELEIELVAHSYRDHSNIVLVAIQPYFKECKNLNSMRVTYHNEYGRPVPSALSFNSLSSQIDHSKWLFTYGAYDDENEVRFSLER